MKEYYLIYVLGSWYKNLKLMMNGDIEMEDPGSEKVAILDAGAQYGKV